MMLQDGLVSSTSSSASAVPTDLAGPSGSMLKSKPKLLLPVGNPHRQAPVIFCGRLELEGGLELGIK